MIKKVIKRDGRIVDFDKTKIAEAIWKAAQSVGGKDKERAYYLADKVVEFLEKKLKPGEIPHVETIQDAVEKILVENGHYKTAKAYILYRALHAQIREFVDSYLDEKSWLVKENANTTYSLQALNFHISSQVTSRYWLHRVFDKGTPEIRKAHLNGDFHIHNLGILGPYCVGWDLRDLLLNGFRGVRGKITSKPPKHFRVALGQVVNFIFTLQGEAAGAQAFSNFDTYLAPFIRYDKLNYKEVKQALQEFIFNMNVPTRVGFQTPFSNITLDLKVPKFMENEPVIIGGKLVDAFGDFQEEMDIFNLALAEVMIEGDGVGRTFTFPIPTINITKDFDWENPAIKKVFETSSKYGIPYFANFINSDMKPEDVRSMCLYPTEEIIAKNDNEILRFRIESLVEKYAGKFDEEGWASPKKKVSVLSLNPTTLKIEWQPVVRFLRKAAQEFVRIATADGKIINVTLNHPVVVLSQDGMKIKLAKDVKVGDILLSLRGCKEILKTDYKRIALIEKTYFKISDKQLKQLHALGLSDSQIASFVSMHKDYVAKRRRKLKLKPNKPTKINKQKLLLIKKILHSSLVLNEKLASFLGLFTAYGNYLFDYRNKKDIKGIKFTFRNNEIDLKKKVKELANEIFGVEVKEENGPRDIIYIYDSIIAHSLHSAGFKKYGRLPKVLFNSPLPVIEAFIKHFFFGNGYKRERKIHMSDKELARDLVILCSLIGIPASYKEGKKSQIYLHENPGYYELLSEFSKRMVGIKSLEKSNLIQKLLCGDVVPIRVKSIKKLKLKQPKFFYDIELKDNHLFIHSLGTITHNCCRLRIDQRELRKRGGGFFGANPLTGSIGVVTINLPRIGYLSKTESDFFERLEKIMELAKKVLIKKREWLEKFTEKGLYPYSKFYLRNIKKEFGKYWKNHFNTIGLIGMNEACLNFLGCSIAEKEGLEFALKVLDFMRERLADFQVETGEMFNLEATPAEGTSYRLAKIDKQKYPKIKVANEDALSKGFAPYYTNSTQLPVYFTDDLWKALKLQDPLQVKYTGGTVFHIWLGESNPPVESVMRLVKKVCENFKLPYFTITPTFSICPIHGYFKGKQEFCPKCEIEGKKTACEIYSRVVGYLRPVEQWNVGKQSEFKQRKTFDKALMI